MVKAIFIDFYGTIVHEDGDVIKQVCQKIFDTGVADDKKQIGVYWWKTFQTLFTNSFGENFKNQRKLELQSLEKTIQRFQSTADAAELSNKMFEHWVKPPIFEESKLFFKRCAIPIYVVSNIDRADILQAIAFHNLTPVGVFTSEDARAYKPRKELFELAMNSVGLKANEIVHIGDSLSSDVQGATSVGINAIWINRNHKEIPKGVISVGNLMEIFDTTFFDR